MKDFYAEEEMTKEGELLQKVIKKLDTHFFVDRTWRPFCYESDGCVKWFYVDMKFEEYVDKEPTECFKNCEACPFRRKEEEMSDEELQALETRQEQGG